MIFESCCACFCHPILGLVIRGAQKDLHSKTGCGARILGITQLVISGICVIVGWLYKSKNYITHYDNNTLSATWGLLAIGGVQAICGCLLLVGSYRLHNDVLMKIIKCINIFLILGSIAIVFALRLTWEDAWGKGKSYNIAEIVILFVGMLIAAFACVYAKVILNRGWLDPQMRRILGSSQTRAATQSASTKHGNGSVYTALTTTTDNSINFGYETQQTHDQARLINDGDD